MARWEPDSQGRLQRAALELYGERGFDNTTVAEIAARAGLTERTFFRYYADKREVLFWGAASLQEFMVDTVAAAPLASTPIGAVAAALEATGTFFDEDRRASARQRQNVIAANTELRERELIKLAALAGALAEALRGRGVTDPAATLTAEAGIAVFKIAFQRWIDNHDRDLAHFVRESLAELKAVTAGA